MCQIDSVHKLVSALLTHELFYLRWIRRESGSEGSRRVTFRIEVDDSFADNILHVFFAICSRYHRRDSVSCPTENIICDETTQSHNEEHERPEIALVNQCLACECKGLDQIREKEGL